MRSSKRKWFRKFVVLIIIAAIAGGSVFLLQDIDPPTTLIVNKIER